MAQELSGMRVAMLVADGFEESEMVQPRQALQKAGAKVDLISPEEATVRSLISREWANEFEVDVQLQDARPEDYDALVLPGGIINPDVLRITPGAIEFIRTFVADGKPIAAICHGLWTLINAQAVKGKKLTSWPSLEIDLKNAGALWVDQEVVTDGKLVSSRKPADIPAFNKAMIALFARG